MGVKAGGVPQMTVHKLPPTRRQTRRADGEDRLTLVGWTSDSLMALMSLAAPRCHDWCLLQANSPSILRSSDFIEQVNPSCS